MGVTLNLLDPDDADLVQKTAIEHAASKSDTENEQFVLSTT